MGTSLTKCSSKFDTISTNRPTVEVANCDIDIDIVTMNMNNTKRIHSTNDASWWSTIGGTRKGILGSVIMG